MSLNASVNLKPTKEGGRDDAQTLRKKAILFNGFFWPWFKGFESFGQGRKWTQRFVVDDGQPKGEIRARVQQDYMKSMKQLDDDETKWSAVSSRVKIEPKEAEQDEEVQVVDKVPEEVRRKKREHLQLMRLLFNDAKSSGSRK